jgi:hypothetical protein
MVAALSKKASKRRFQQLKKAGCAPKRVRMPSGDSVILKKKGCVAECGCDAQEDACAHDFPTDDAALEHAREKFHATHWAYPLGREGGGIRETEIAYFVYTPTREGAYERREIYKKRGYYHFSKEYGTVSALPKNAILFEGMRRQIRVADDDAEDWWTLSRKEDSKGWAPVGTFRHKRDAMYWQDRKQKEDPRHLYRIMPYGTERRAADEEGTIPTKRELQIIGAFRERKALGKLGDPISTDGETIFSYRMPIGRRNPDGSFWIESASAAPSVTTRNHIYGLERTLAMDENPIEPLEIAFEDTAFSVWEESGNVRVKLSTAIGNKKIAEWRDEEVRDWLNPIKLHRSAYDYAVQLGLIRRPGARDNPIEIESADEPCIPWVKIARDPEKYEACLAQARALGPIKGDRKVYDLLAPALMKEDQEVFCVVLLDVRMQVRGVSEVHRGARSRVGVSVADVMRLVLREGAEGFVVVHNHPSGKGSPSKADEELTEAFRAAVKPYEPDVVFVDHIVIGAGEYYSFADAELHHVKKGEGI